LGIITKWFLVPGLLAATGYFFIGPRVGDKVIPKNIKDRIPAVAGTPGTQAVQNEKTDGGDDSTESTPKTFTAPQVDVSVSPIGNATKPKKKRHRRKKKPAITAPVDGATSPVPPPDNGGGGTDGGATPPPVGHDG